MDDYTQLGRRNLTSGELIYANSMVADEIALENKGRQLKGTYKSYESRNKVSVHLDADLNTPEKCRDRSTNTREQVAKMSGVGTGTVARFNKVMNSDNEELKKKVLTNEVSINAGYKELTQNRTLRIEYFWMVWYDEIHILFVKEVYM